MALSPTVFEKMCLGWIQQQINELTKQAGSPQDVMNLALEVPSTSKKEVYAWLGAVPGVKEWLTDKQLRKLSDLGFEILNRPFYSGFQVDRNDLRDDQVGSYKAAVQALVVRMEQFKRKMIVDLATGGTSGLAFDGVAFFSNVSGARTIDNLLAGTGTTLAQIAADIDSTVQAMMAFPDEEGEAMNVVPDLFLVPPALKRSFDTICFSPGDASSSSPNARNPFLNYNFTVIADARVAAVDANDWYAFCTKGVLKPFILQNREGIRSVMDEGTTKKNRNIDYSVEWDGNAGYGLPWLAAKVVNT